MNFVANTSETCQLKPKFMLFTIHKQKSHGWIEAKRERQLSNMIVMGNQKVN